MNTADITAALDAGSSMIVRDPAALAMLGVGTYPGVSPITTRRSRLGTLWWEITIDGRRAYLAPLSDGSVLVEPVSRASGAGSTPLARPAGR